jgi:hypothetical protein
VPVYIYAPVFGAYINRRKRLYNTTTFSKGEEFRIASKIELRAPNLRWAVAQVLTTYLLALHANLGEVQAKLDATAAARTGGGATPNLPDPVRKDE